MKKHLLLALVLFVVSFCKAQLPPGEYTTTNKKAIAFFENGLKLRDAYKEEEAIEQLKKAIAKDSNFVEPYLLLADIYQTNKKAQDAIAMYTKAIDINPVFNNYNFYNLAMLQVELARYEDAKMNFDYFLKKSVMNPEIKERALYNLANCNFAIDAMKHPVPFNPINMGDAINTPYDEYFPAITVDEKIFLFTRNNRTEVRPMQEDFLISRKGPNGWQKAVLIGNGINTPGNEGAPCLSADGQLLFFVACAEIDNNYGPNRKGYGSCDIFCAQKVGENWTQAENVGRPVNTPYYESQPSFSADGKTLYFVSKRPEGYGFADIYVSTLSDDGYWSEPKNLGDKINTPGTEESPYVHPDGKTLYFASDGHVGMGGLDIYVSRKDEKGNWGEPVNLGYPINTYGDENSLLVSASGVIAYFSSNRKGGYGGLDIYHFDLYESVRPGLVTFMKGKVYDSKTNLPVGAHFELIDLTTQKTVIVSSANSGNGEFVVTLPADKNYALNVSHPGYLFHSENFSLKGFKDTTQPFMINVPLEPIDTSSAPVELKNVFFETAQFYLKVASEVELNKLVTFLNNNKKLKIELDGHTDNVGDKKMNLELSRNRAKSVYEYLINNGIDASRLSYKGYGDTKPKVPNDSDEHRAMNRRTEFKVVGM